MTSPHQPKTLADRITELKEEQAEYRAARTQILALGQTSSGAGLSTTYPSLDKIQARLDWLEAQIAALTAQLVGDDAQPPGVNYIRHRNDENNWLT